MFVYEVKELYNEAGEGPFSGMVVKPGTDFIPAVAGETVLFVKEVGNGEIELVDEFVVGEKPGEKEGPYFYSHEDDSEQFNQLESNYAIQQAVGGDMSWYIDIPELKQTDALVLLCVKDGTAVTAESSSGYNFKVDLGDTYVGSDPSTEYYCIIISPPIGVDDVFEKLVGGNPATDITLSTGGATCTCTIYIIESS